MRVLDPGGDGMLAIEPGYDHEWFEWRAASARPTFTWPGERPVAVAVVISLGAAEWENGDQELLAVPGGRGIAPFPDIPRMSHREFGHRVGIFRVLNGLESIGIPATVAVDVLTVEAYRGLADYLRTAPELMAAGLSASRPITSRMTPDDEAHYVTTSLDRLTVGLDGIRPNGWLGPAHGESARTPAVLAAAGLRYAADWGNDDQPYPMAGAAPGLWSLPLSWELSDLAAMFHRQVLPRDYGRSVIDAAHRLARESSVPGSTLGLLLHPWVSGQAFRWGPVAEALAALRSDDRFWFATPGQIIDWMVSR